MPIYEYRCKECGKISEFLVGVGKNKDERTCKNCGSENLRKVFSTPYVNSENNLIAEQSGKTCCGREERCSTPPCSINDGECRR